MTHVALVCPRLLFTIGMRIDGRPGRRHTTAEIARVLEELGVPLARGFGDRWYSVELADPVDAVIAYQTLHRAFPELEPEVHAIVGSAAALAMVVGDPIAQPAWERLRADITINEVDDSRPIEEWRPVIAEPLDVSRGLVAVRPFRLMFAWPVPDEIAEQRLPTGGLVLHLVGGGIVVVDREPFVIGRDPLCDLQLDTSGVSPRHATFTRSNEGWQIESAEGSSGFSIDGQRPARRAEVRPGMVIELARGHTAVVLAIG